MQATTNAYVSTPRPVSPRIEEIDWLRCVCILLVVTFHIVWIERRYEAMHSVVSIFHVPVFLLISGYLAQVERPLRVLARSLAPWLAAYLTMESLYVVMASRLPVADNPGSLTPWRFAQILLLHPIGIYWYLHTLILCYVLLSASLRLRCLKRHDRCIVFLICALLLHRADVLSMTHVLFFMAGWLLRQSAMRFNRCFAPSLLAIIPFVLIACSGEARMGSMLAFTAVVLVMMFLLFAYRHLQHPVRSVAACIGRNTLPILLFSPAFTFAAKLYQPWLLAMDATGILFLLLTLVLTCSLSIGLWRLIGLLLNVCHTHLQIMFAKTQ